MTMDDATNKHYGKKKFHQYLINNIDVRTGVFHQMALSMEVFAICGLI